MELTKILGLRCLVKQAPGFLSLVCYVIRIQINKQSSGAKLNVHQPLSGAHVVLLYCCLTSTVNI